LPPETEFYHGRFHADGDGIPIKNSAVAHYFKSSADQGHALAQRNCGHMLAIGDDIPMNTSLAAHY
jgi:TPR repeat protein